VSVHDPLSDLRHEADIAYRLQVRWNGTGSYADLDRTRVRYHPPQAPRVALHPNVPNPFNPVTIISFDLPRGGYTSLIVYDLTGRLVRTLVAEVLPAGGHQRKWDGVDNGGEAVAAGVYFCVLDHEAGRIASRMTLVK
jgi:hypothetical protein